MEEFWRLVLLSSAMFIGCYAAGAIPLALTLSEGVLRRVTTFGAGLLIGTALIVIIPEGVESLFSADLVCHKFQSHPHHDTVAVDAVVERGEDADSLSQDAAIAAAQSDTPRDLPVEVAAPEDGYGEEELQMMMGVSLTLGFIFMLLVDQCGGGGHTHSPVTDAESTGGRHTKRKLTATIGLVVHAAADGLALGAAAGLSKVDVEIIIFLAIMLHKAPAAFGFTSFLIHEGYDRFTAKRHLLAFALAAPIAAFVSYFGLVRVMYTVQLPFTGIAMLFSAGTFLYVATVHVLNELTTNSRPHGTLGSGVTATAMTDTSSKLSTLELLLLVLGAVLPLGFNIVHSH